MMPDRASWCLLPRPLSAPLQTGSTTPNYEGTRTPEVHAPGAWTWAISTYSCVLTSAEWKSPLVLPLETHFQIDVILQHVSGGGHLDPLGTRKGNSTARPNSAKVVLADTCRRSPGICPSRHPADPRPI